MTEFENFCHSIGALRDNVVAAIEKSDLGTAMEGFVAYQSLLINIADHNTALRVKNREADGAASTSGREWDRVVRDLFVLVDLAAASRSTHTWVEVVSWCRGVATQFVDRGDLGGTRDVLRLIEAMWHRDLLEPGPDRRNRQVALLLPLSEFGAFNLRHESEPERAAGLDTLVARSLANITKTAIDAEDAESAVLAIEYLSHALWDNQQAELRASTALALYAWILYLVDHGHDDSMPAVRDALASLLDPGEPLVAVLPKALSERAESELGWGWWELRGLGPVQSGFLQMSSFVYLAAVFLSRAQSLLGWREEPIDRSVADGLVRAVDSLLDNRRARLRRFEPRSDQVLAELRAQLQGQVDAADLRQETARAVMPLSNERRQRFADAVASALAEARSESLTAALESPWANPPDDATTQFGLDTLMPRYYFADTDVYAEPEALAKDLASSLVRGEQDAILRNVVAGLDEAPAVQMNHLTEALRSVLSSRVDGSTVVVTNSFAAFRTLTGSPGALDEHVATLERSRMIRVYDDRPPYVAVLNGDGAPAVHRGAAPPVVEGDELLPEADVVLGVTELGQDVMDDIIAREPRTSMELARLRASLRVRIQEQFEAALTKPDQVVLLRLPDDSW